jgi:hypothetical protein
MLVSYVLRVVAPESADGHVAGRIEDVKTGVTVTFSSVAELLAVLVPRSGDETPPESS